MVFCDGMNEFSYFINCILFHVMFAYNPETLQKGHMKIISKIKTAHLIDI